MQHSVSKIDTIAEIIAKTYDCALAPRLWPDVLQQIATLAGGAAAMILDAGGVVFLSRGADAGAMARYLAAHSVAEGRDQARFAQRSAGRVVIRCDDLATSRAALGGQPHITALLQMGVTHRAGAGLGGGAVLVLHFHRAPMAEARRRQVQRLLPHLAMARGFAAVQAQNQALGAVLDRLNYGVAIVRVQGDVVLCNRVFLALAARHGLLMRQRLAVRLGAGSVAVTGGLFLEVSPLAGDYLVSLWDSAPVIDAQRMREVFGVTKAEGLVMDLVVKGHTNAEIAVLRDRSLETINSQLKALMQKSGSRNRTDLVRMAVSLSSIGRG